VISQYCLAHKLNPIQMKKFFKEIDWRIDYYFVYFLYNSNKVHRYHRYMIDKWGARYTGK
jgi:hypothetical protein